MKIEIVLVVAAPNIKCPGNTKFLVMETNPEQLLTLPYQAVLEDELVMNSAVSLLKTLTGLHARVNGVGWVDLHQTSLIDRFVCEHRVISIPFGCMIPEEVAVLNGSCKWMTYSELFAKEWFGDHLDILSKVVRQI